MTSVMMYKIDKTIRKSVESASDTVILRVATEAVTVFLLMQKQKLESNQNEKWNGHFTHSISRLKSSTIAENTPNSYINMTFERVQTCCSWSDWTSKKHPWNDGPSDIISTTTLSPLPLSEIYCFTCAKYKIHLAALIRAGWSDSSNWSRSFRTTLFRVTSLSFCQLGWILKDSINSSNAFELSRNSDCSV